MIKTPDLCERCVYSVEHCKALEVCNACPMCSAETGRCKCLTIKHNTPCPYFEEDENGAAD